MAKIEEATVYVQEIEGNRLKLSEKHSRKDPQSEQWITTGYTDITGWLPRDYQGPALAVGNRLKVSAFQRTEDRESNGKKYKNLIWNLLSCEVVTSQTQSGVQSRQQQRDYLPSDEEMPF